MVLAEAVMTHAIRANRPFTMGLYVADASVIPTALGVNPYMTIGALAERTAYHIVNNPNHGHMFVG